MITIRFLNVGQGDSIILEWEKDGKDQVGIIDCNKNGDRNPVLEYLKSKHNKIIRFIILSHPHSDHYSGLQELIADYIEHKLKIDYFLHTATNMPSFWQMAAIDAKSQSELHGLFKILRKAHEVIDLRYHCIQGESINDDIDLGSFHMKILAPTSTQLDKYALGIKYEGQEREDEEGKGNNPNANWLSTFIKIYNDRWFVLLTSDVEKDVFTYYGLKKPEELKGQLILAQSPHHGSNRNHSNAFWRNISRRDDTPIVFSVGKNHYGHPGERVVRFFTEHRYNIYSTNKVGGLTAYVEKNENISTALDMFSTQNCVPLIDKYSGDKVFVIDAQGNLS